MDKNSSPIYAPEFPGADSTWFNVALPLQLETLRGKLVILDFWTFCCINCMHILPVLRAIEETFPEEVVVIGVHCPKFSAEHDSASVAAAIMRYGIQHPVVHDPNFRIWRAYAVRAWPTLVFVAPDGRIIGQHLGEPDRDNLISAVTDMLAQWRDAGVLQPSRLFLTPPPGHPGKLRFPGKLRQIPGGNEKNWVLADSGHNQVVVLDDAGVEHERYGAGHPGLQDGSADQALFDSPQGLVATKTSIFVADTGNHALRCIDLATRRVTTLAGNGRRGAALGDPTPGATTALASPWDVEMANGVLFFANAGTHQLGAFDIGSKQVRRLAGSGAEGIADGNGPFVTLAQPSGLALSLNSDALYFVDSETSSLRVLSLENLQKVMTMIGTGLFDFGHSNGPLQHATLQHPLGLAACNDRLAIADSYNNVVRIVDLPSDRVEDLDSGQFHCGDAYCLSLAEPAGIAWDGPNRLLVVDTNNHRVVEYDLAGYRYRTWAG